MDKIAPISAIKRAVRTANTVPVTKFSPTEIYRWGSTEENTVTLWRAGKSVAHGIMYVDTDSIHATEEYSGCDPLRLGALKCENKLQ